MNKRSEINLQIRKEVVLLVFSEIAGAKDRKGKKIRWEKSNNAKITFTHFEPSDTFEYAQFVKEHLFGKPAIHFS